MLSFLRLLGSFCIISLTAAPSTNSAEFWVPDHDLRLSLNLSIIETILDTFRQAEYRGEFVRGTSICNSPNIKFNVDSLETAVNGFFDFPTHLIGLGGRADANVSATITNCLPGDPPITVSASCSLALPFANAVGGTAVLVGGCVARLIESVRLSFFVPIAMPIALNDGINIHLPVGTAEQTYEFGSYENNQWETSRTPLFRNIRLFPRIGPLDPQPKLTTIQSITFVERPTALAIDGVAGTEVGRFHHSEIAAVTDFVADNPLDQGALLGFSLSPKFFAHTSLEGDRRGILNQALPIRVSGEYEAPSGKKLKYEVVVVSARAGVVPGVPTTRILLVLEAPYARVWDSATGNDLGVQSVDAWMSIEPPAILPTGAIHSEISDVQLQINTALGPICQVCNTPALRQAFQRLIPDIELLTKTVNFTMPDCLSVGDGRMKPKDGNWNNARCADGRTSDAVKLQSPRSLSIDLDLSAVSPTFKDGRFVYSIPAAVSHH